MTSKYVENKFFRQIDKIVEIKFKIRPSKENKKRSHQIREIKPPLSETFDESDDEIIDLCSRMLKT